MRDDGATMNGEGFFEYSFNINQAIEAGKDYVLLFESTSSNGVNIPFNHDTSNTYAVKDQAHWNNASFVNAITILDSYGNLVDSVDNAKTQRADLAYVEHDSSSSNGESQVFLVDNDGNPFSLESNQELLGSRRITGESFDASGHTLTDGYELIVFNNSTDVVSSIEFNVDGTLNQPAQPLSESENRSREISMQRDLNNDGIVGIELTQKLYPSNNDYDNSDGNNYRCIYLGDDDSLILSRVDFDVPGYPDGYYDGSGMGVDASGNTQTFDLKNDGINMWGFVNSAGEGPDVVILSNPDGSPDAWQRQHDR